MKKLLFNIFKYIVLLFIGGLMYYAVEIIYRGYSDFSMVVCGGVCFVVYGLLNEFYDWEVPICSQLVIGATTTTLIEFITGFIVNIWLSMNVWDYSNMPYNIMGQVCLIFWFAWAFLGIFAIILDDWIRFKFFNEEVPRYTIFGVRK